MGGVIDVLIADDPEEATERLLPFLAYQMDTYRRYRVEGTGEPEPSPMTADRLREGLQSKGSLPGFVVVDPKEAVTQIKERIAGLPVRHVYLWASVAGMPDDLADRHVELLLTEVRPALQA
jgi:hypothetical protein